MGDFRMTIEAAGGHGCDRRAKPGEQLQSCGHMGCPDCMFASFVSWMQRTGMRPYTATMHHWPANLKLPEGSSHGYTEEHEVVDDYSEKNVKYPSGGYTKAMGIRVKGSF